MRTKPQGAPDQAVAALASRQHGVISQRQLIELSVGRSAIKRRCVAGRLHRLHRGVYAVGHSAVTARGRWLAAVLACGPDAVLSHRSAAALWELRPYAAPAVDVTVAASGRRPRRHIWLHQVRDVAVADRTLHDRIPVTTVPRTLLDLAEVLPHREFERAFEAAERTRRLDPRAVRRLLDRSRGRRGAGFLGALLAEDRAGVAATRSALEARFLAVCREAGLPRPVVNARVAGFEVDAVWPAERLVVELDGYAYHHTRTAFERDRARDAALQLAGYRVVRVTYRMLESDPAAVVDLVRSLLIASPRL